MKNLLKLTLYVFLLTLLFVNVIISNNKSELFPIGNLIALNTANAEYINGDNKQCLLLLGVGCRPDKCGATCHDDNDC